MPSRPVTLRRWEIIAAFLMVTAAFVGAVWRIQTGLDRTNQVVRSNRGALAELCDQSFITAAVLQQTVVLLKSEAVTRTRSQTIGIIQGYLALLQERPECVARVQPTIGVTTPSLPSTTVTTKP